MAHNLTFNSTTGLWEMMSRGATWHNLGQITTEAQTAEDARKLAGMTHEVEKRQLDCNGVPVPVWGLFRSDKDVEDGFICSTTETFEVLQYDDCFDYLDLLVESQGAHYEAAGIINNGQQAFMVLNIGEAFEVVPGDRHEMYLNFLEDRTGTRAAQVKATDLRTVCANTFEANYHKGGDAIRFNHRRNIRERMAEAAATIVDAKQNVQQFRAKLNWLAGVNVTAETVETLLTRMFGENNNTAKKDIFLDCFERNDGDAFPQVRGTGYNAFNAITEYFDHAEPVVRTQSRLMLTDGQVRGIKGMLGDGSAMKYDAVNFLMDAIKNQKGVAMASRN